MTVAKQTVADIFADARQLHEASLLCLAENDIRDAAEKAWCAVMRATAALVFSRTGTEPEKSTGISREIRSLARQDHRAQGLVSGGRTCCMVTVSTWRCASPWRTSLTLSGTH